LSARRKASLLGVASSEGGLPFCHYFRHFTLDNYQQNGIIKIAFGWGQKAHYGKLEVI
jgi:hypothetical protein